jgi:putative restriction endonuclease
MLIGMADVVWLGEIPGIEVGTVFGSRHEVRSAGVHRALQAGIVGSRNRGAESIVVSGGYEDDEDYGDVIIYTGHGGNDPATRRQSADQSFDAPGNAALVTSALTGAPVRVVRGRNSASSTAPVTGYRYDGLFRVDSWWRERGRSGYYVCRFKLVSVTGDGSTSQGSAGEQGLAPAGTAAPVRVSAVVQRIVRSGRVVEYVKQLHDHTCQMCGVRLVVRGRGYSEGAHIRALGRPHMGPDVPANVLCLCPNCHVLFDNGAIVVTDDFVVQTDGGGSSILHTVPAHDIDPTHFAYHREIHH